MKRGKIRWYKFAKPDKKRPVLILTRNSIIDYLGEVTVAPLTTTIREIPSEVVITPHDGVAQLSAISLDVSALASSTSQNGSTINPTKIHIIQGAHIGAPLQITSANVSLHKSSETAYLFTSIIFSFLANYITFVLE